MAMNPNTVSVHEAGHAVMQWLVGWEADCHYIQMERVEGGVINGFMKIPPPDRECYRELGTAKRKLLVLLAGAATTDDPAAQHNQLDFQEACFVLNFLFAVRIGWKNGTGVEVTQPGPNALLQEANMWCKAIVREKPVRAAVDRLADELLRATPNDKGICRVMNPEIIEICEQSCGSAIREQNSWSAWIRDSKRPATIADE